MKRTGPGSHRGDHERRLRPEASQRRAAASPRACRGSGVGGEAAPYGSRATGLFCAGEKRGDRIQDRPAAMGRDGAAGRESRMAGRKRSRRGRAAGPVARMRNWCGRRFTAMRSACAARRRPWRPTVEADVDGRQGRRLRRAITRVTRDHLRGLGVAPPGHLLVVVQRTVTLEERPLESLLQVFEDAEGHRRHVLFLALTASGRDVDDEELLATLRQQLQRVVAPQLGTPVSMPQEPAGSARRSRHRRNRPRGWARSRRKHRPWRRSRAATAHSPPRREGVMEGDAGNRAHESG